MADKRIRVIGPLGDPRQDEIDEKVRQIIEQEEIDAEVARRMGLVEEYGEDEYPDETVFKFSKRHNDDGPPYTYVVIKVKDHWYTSGAFSRRTDWAGLVLWLVSGKFPVRFESLRQLY